ncbi:hypothetical protein [Natronoflexus pectinivorans]|uniref:SpoIIAA-like protein n=1 Tax=Natronoflexus pectinivorans TaxID=682526 RepID=A0A4R2GI20_9BACT|nr:hypothetical protein [Natronoflexus pectinivorans]TCO06929.1 hypothetical protein EV194_11145 [Natronoflexus pectinivorans]
MKRCDFIECKGVRIFYIDFSNLKNIEEIKAVINESKNFIRSQPPKSMINLANIEGMHFNGEIKELFVEYVKGNANHVFQSAIIGVDGLRRIVFNGVLKLTGRDVRCLESKQAAMDWLAERKLASLPLA